MQIRYSIRLAGTAAVLFLTYAGPSMAQPWFARPVVTPAPWQQHQAALWHVAPRERADDRARYHDAMAKRAAAMGLLVPHNLPPMGRGRALRPPVWNPAYGLHWHPYNGWVRPTSGRCPPRPWARGWRG